MLKKRIIPVQLLIGERLVKTKGFGEYRDVGNPVSSSKVYCDQDADELVFLSISRENRSPEGLLSLLKNVSKVCFMPLAVGGGISQYEHAEMLIRGGADKVVINSAAYHEAELIPRVSRNFGAQAVVISIDVRRAADGTVELFSDCGRKKEPVSLQAHIERVTALGAGEIFINSIDRDGMMKGYDIDLILETVKSTRLPVIGCGGAGHFDHMKQAFLETGVSALACGSLFNFGDNNPIRAKAFLKNSGLPFKVVQ